MTPGPQQADLQGLPENWIAGLRTDWEILEEIYSAAVVLSQGVINEDGRELVSSAINRISMRIDEALSGNHEWGS